MLLTSYLFPNFSQVKGDRLTALVLGRTSDLSNFKDDDDDGDKLVPFGDSDQARIVSVACKHKS